MGFSRQVARLLPTFLALLLILAVVAACGPPQGKNLARPTLGRAGATVARHRFGTLAAPLVGDTFHSSAGSWSIPVSGIAYQWQDCTGIGSSGYGTGCTNVASATSNSYSVQQADVGKRIAIVVTATFTTGQTATQPSLATGVVAPGATSLTPGPGTWSSPATFSTGGFPAMTYRVYWPSNANPAVKNGKRALMLAIHGCTQSLNTVINKGYNWEATSEQYGMVIVAPSDPNASSDNACWTGPGGWTGMTNARTNQDPALLIGLAQSIINNPQYSIDSHQVYSSGLSAGAATTNNLLCLAPDVFAGGGIGEGPALGSDDFGNPSEAPSTVSSTCNTWAGQSGVTGSFATQIVSIVEGSNDGVVRPGNDTANGQGRVMLFGLNSTAASTFTVSGGGSGSNFVDSNGKIRLSMMRVANTNPTAGSQGHTWFSGPGGASNDGSVYVDYKYITYPAYLTQFLFQNNLR